jgi:hypothetical protein
MNLQSLIIETKSVWVDYPGLEGLKVEVAALSRPELIALRKRCTITKFNKQRQAEEVLDEDKFVREFTRATVKGWAGFKLKYLEGFLLVDLKAKDPEALLEYTEDNAQTLVTNSADFDSWLNEVVFDLDNFRTKPAGVNVGTTGKVV